jgi:hypothetical protein
LRAGLGRLDEGVLGNKLDYNLFVPEFMKIFPCIHP